MRRHLAFAVSCALVLPGLNVSASVPSAAQRWSDWGEPDRELVMSAHYDVGPGSGLLVDVADADVTVRSGAGDEIRFEVWLVTHDLDEGRRRFERMNFRADGNTSRAELHSDPVGNGRDWSWRRNGTFRIEVDVIAPRQIAAELRSGDGDIAIERIEGRVRAHSSDGDVTAQNLQGDVELRTSDGDIGVAILRGPRVVLATSDGDINLGDVETAHLSVETSDGDISAARLVADQLQLSTSDGDIVLQSVAGALSARTNDGNIHVGIENLAATTLSTGDGDITILAADTLAAQLDLQGSHLTMRSERSFDGRLDGTLNKRLVRGTLNQGGPTLKARTGDGTIVLSLSGPR